ncbi:peroxisomal membrane protein pex14 [Basidiobolus ranarum]|uniref:Peroxisomal membrane protein PEX14 n=1 Tax=Basidiobolus ranarum TaxID=34480 RepID=A0ABR2W8W2_9FUNG
MTEAIRENVLKSAIHFLRIPQVNKSSLAKKIAFLESKGLTTGEIQAALKQATSESSQNNFKEKISTQELALASRPLPAIPTRESKNKSTPWKHYLTTAAAAGSIGCGLYHLAKRCTLPNIKGNTQAELEAELREIDARYEAASSSLLTVKKDTLDMIEYINTQKDEMKTSVENMSGILSQLKSQDSERDQELQSLRQELHRVKSIIPKILENQKESQNTMLTELQKELKSLKDLLITRKTTSIHTLTPPISPNSMEGSADGVVP